MNPSLKDLKLIVEKYTRFCTDEQTELQQDSVNPRERTKPQGLGIILWRKILEMMATLKEDDQGMAFQLLWNSLVDQMNEFVTNCLKIAPELTPELSTRSCMIIQQTCSKFFRDLLSAKGDAGFKTEWESDVNDMQCTTETALQTDYIELEPKLFVEAIAFPSAEIMIQTGRQPYEQQVGLKVWELAIRQQWLVTTLRQEGKYFLSSIQNALNLCRQAGNEIRGHHENKPGAMAFKFSFGYWEPVRDLLIPSALSVIEAMLEYGYLLPGSLTTVSLHDKLLCDLDVTLLCARDLEDQLKEYLLFTYVKLGSQSGLILRPYPVFETTDFSLRRTCLHLDDYGPKNLLDCGRQEIIHEFYFDCFRKIQNFNFCGYSVPEHDFSCLLAFLGVRKAKKFMSAFSGCVKSSSLRSYLERLISSPPCACSTE